MAFILNSDRTENSVEELRSNWKNYCDYLELVRDQLPESAYKFATAEWHYNFQDHKCPHDGWLEELIVREPSSGERHQIRGLEISISLLAAYHDGYIELNYKDVKSYLFENQMATSFPNCDHGDWLYDEIRLSKDGFVLHEIEWHNGSKWLIECKDVSYSWKELKN